jgi:hypothetical protein
MIFINYSVLSFTVCFCSHKCIVRYNLDSPDTGKMPVFWSTIGVLVRLLLWRSWLLSSHLEFVYEKIICRETWKYMSKLFWSRNRLMIWCSTLDHLILPSSNLWSLRYELFLLPAIIDVLILYLFLLLLFRGYLIMTKFMFRVLICEKNNVISKIQKLSFYI